MADRLARTPGGAGPLLVVLLLLTAAVTAVLNLDTSVAFLTPILILTARRRGAPVEPFLYGVTLMSNSASLLLPGSNLTNLLVLHGDAPSGAAFAARMAPAFVVAVVCTIGFLLLRYRDALHALPAMAAFRPAGPAGPGEHLPHAGGASRRLAAVGIVGAAGLVVLLAAPALPVLGLGVVAVTVRRYNWRDLLSAVNPETLAGLFGVCVALGTLAANWSAPTRLVAGASSPFTAALGALAAVSLNNLPAAVLLSAGRIASPEALLLGLNLGPNLAVTGSLSAVLWHQAARQTGADPSFRTFSRLGIVLAPLSIAACLAVLALWPVARF